MRTEPILQTTINTYHSSGDSPEMQSLIAHAKKFSELLHRVVDGRVQVVGYHQDIMTFLGNLPDSKREPLYVETVEWVWPATPGNE